MTLLSTNGFDKKFQEFTRIQTKLTNHSGYNVLMMLAEKLIDQSYLTKQAVRVRVSTKRHS